MKVGLADVYAASGLLRVVIESCLIQRVMLTYPSDFPAGCPLPSSSDCGGDVYLLVQSLQLDPLQFQTQAERGRALNAVGDEACKRLGLSVFPTYESCSHQRRLFPRLGSYIATATLSAVDGKISNTPSHKNPTHQTWWPYPEVVRHALFSVMEF